MGNEQKKFFGFSEEQMKLYNEGKFKDYIYFITDNGDEWLVDKSDIDLFKMKIRDDGDVIVDEEKLDDIANKKDEDMTYKSKHKTVKNDSIESHTMPFMDMIKELTDHISEGSEVTAYINGKKITDPDKIADMLNDLSGGDIFDIDVDDENDEDDEDGEFVDDENDEDDEDDDEDFKNHRFPPFFTKLMEKRKIPTNFLEGLYNSDTKIKMNYKDLTYDDVDKIMESISYDIKSINPKDLDDALNYLITIKVPQFIAAFYTGFYNNNISIYDIAKLKNSKYAEITIPDRNLAYSLYGYGYDSICDAIVSDFNGNEALAIRINVTKKIVSVRDYNGDVYYVKYNSHTYLAPWIPGTVLDMSFSVMASRNTGDILTLNIIDLYRKTVLPDLLRIMHYYYPTLYSSLSDLKECLGVLYFNGLRSESSTTRKLTLLALPEKSSAWFKLGEDAHLMPMDEKIMHVAKSLAKSNKTTKFYVGNINGMVTLSSYDILKNYSDNQYYVLSQIDTVHQLDYWSGAPTFQIFNIPIDVCIDNMIRLKDPRDVYRKFLIDKILISDRIYNISENNRFSSCYIVDAISPEMMLRYAGNYNDNGKKSYKWLKLYWDCRIQTKCKVELLPNTHEMDALFYQVYGMVDIYTDYVDECLEHMLKVSNNDKDIKDLSATDKTNILLLSLDMLLENYFKSIGIDNLKFINTRGDDSIRPNYRVAIIGKYKRDIQSGIESDFIRCIIYNVINVPNTNIPFIHDGVFNKNTKKSSTKKPETNKKESNESVVEKVTPEPIIKDEKHDSFIGKIFSKMFPKKKN